MSELDSLLDATLDDLADLPEFKVFPPGTHRAKATMDTKEINKHPAVELNLVYMECLELADPETPESDMCAEGDSSSVAYMLDNEFGQGNLKKVATPLGEALGASSLREIVEQVTDIEVVVVTKVRTDKNDPDKKYMQVVEISVI